MPVWGAQHHTQHHYDVTDVCLTIPISYQDVSGAVALLPANCIITARQVVRTTPWNNIALFAVGKPDNLDWLVKNYQHNLSLQSQGAVEVTGEPVYVANETPLVFTWDHGGATQGAGYVVLCYKMLEAAP